MLNGASDDSILSEAHDVDEVRLRANITHDSLVAAFVDERNETEGVCKEKHSFSRHFPPYGDTWETHFEDFSNSL